MKRKLLTMMLCGVLGISMLAGCGKEQTDTKEKVSYDYPDYPEFIATDYVTLGDYQDLTVEVATASEIMDESVMTQLYTDFADRINGDEDKQKAIFSGGGTVAETEKIQKGDLVDVSFVGTLDKKTVDGMTADNYKLVVGYGKLMTQLQDAMVGMTTGQSKTFDISFPEDFSDEATAGQTVRFKLTVNQVARLANCDDAVIATVTDNKFNTYDEYKSDMKAQMEKASEYNQENTALSSLMAKIMENAEIKEVPEDLENWYADCTLVSLKAQAASSDLELNDAISQATGEECKNEKEYREYVIENSQDAMKQEVVLQAIAETEELKPDTESEEYEQYLEDVAYDFGFSSVDTMKESYPETRITALVRKHMTEDWLLEHNTVKETKADESN